MSRKYTVSFEVETTNHGFKDSLFDGYKTATVLDGSDGVIRVPEDAVIREVVRSGYWRYKPTGSVFEVENEVKTPFIHKRIQDDINNWEPVTVEAEQC